MIPMFSTIMEKCFMTEEIKQRVQKCQEFIQNHDMAQLEKGRHEIDNENVYVNVIEYQSADAQSRMWEGHRDYIDIHYMISGEEILQVSHKESMYVGEYADEDDFYPAQGNPQIQYMLKKGDMCLCVPNEIHKTGVILGESQEIMKAVFKIKIN